MPSLQGITLQTEKGRQVNRCQYASSDINTQFNGVGGHHSGCSNITYILPNMARRNTVVCVISYYKIKT